MIRNLGERKRGQNLLAISSIGHSSGGRHDRNQVKGRLAGNALGMRVPLEGARTGVT